MGSAEPRGNGRYRARYRDANGEKRTALGPNGETSTKSKRQAEKWANDAEAQIRAGTWQDPRIGTMTLDDYFYNQWMPNRTCGVQTKSSNLSHYTIWIGPHLGKKLLKDITPPVVQRWVVMMENTSGLKASTIGKNHRTLASILGMKRGVSALRDGLITTSPCEFTTLPPLTRKPADFFEVEEVERIMAVMSPWYRPLVMFLAESGVRWGESAGLLVEDFDPDYSGFWIRRTIIRVTKAEAAFLGMPAGQQVQNTTKNHQERYVKLSLEAAEAMRTLVETRDLKPTDRMFSVESSRGSCIVKRTTEFPEGCPIDPGTFRNRAWTTSLKKANVRFRKVHALRASHITWLLAGGLDLPTVMQRVGHADLSTTQVYSGLTKDAYDRTMEALAITKRRARPPIEEGAEALDEWLEDVTDD